MSGIQSIDSTKSMVAGVESMVAKRCLNFEF